METIFAEEVVSEMAGREGEQRKRRATDREGERNGSLYFPA